MFFIIRSLVYFRLLTIFSFISLFICSWFDLWILIEIINFTIIPFFFFNKNNISMVILFKFYTINTLISFIILFSFIWHRRLLIYPIMSLVMMMKINLTPFYFWFIKIIKRIDFKRFIFILTINKLPVFIGITLCLPFVSKEIIVAVILLSLIVPTFHVLNENLLNIIMFLSSRYNSAWMTIIILYKLLKEWILYFLIYSIILSIVIVIFNNAGVEKISDIHITAPFIAFNIILVILNYIRIPPTCRFIIKFMVVFQLIKFSELYVVIFFIIATSTIWLMTYFNLGLKYWLLNSQVHYFSISNFTKLLITTNIFLIYLIYII